MSTCEQSIVARNLERSYAFSEGFVKRTSLRNLTRRVLKNFTKRSCLRFQSCIDRGSTQLRNLEEKLLLREMNQEQMTCEVFSA